MNKGFRKVADIADTSDANLPLELTLLEKMLNERMIRHARAYHVPRAGGRRFYRVSVPQVDTCLAKTLYSHILNQRFK